MRNHGILYVQTAATKADALGSHVDRSIWLLTVDSQGCQVTLTPCRGSLTPFALAHFKPLP